MIELIDKLKTKYTNTDSMNTNETIFQTREVFNDTPISISYFDFSQKIPESIEEMQKYHEEYIIPSYYKESGSIQWNYYIYFIYDDTNKTINKETFTLVEKNKDYARKIIFNKQEFESFLNNDIRSFYENASNIGRDLVGIWRSKLDENNLSFIYDENTPKSRIVDKLLSDNEQQLKKHKKQKSDAELDLRFPDKSDTFINEIHLNEYRKYPKKRNFTSAKVNLIHGVNGAGKTSLLEAIEIVTCGKTFRSKGDNEPFAESLKLIFSEKEYCIDKNTNITYQERDKQWYGSINTWGNKLYENFNKFNFYHTDAAYGISAGLDINGIVKNLVLGKEITTYEKRINDSVEKFETEKRSLERESKELKQRIKSSIEEIEKINNKENTAEKSKLLDAKFKILQSLRWKENALESKKTSTIFDKINAIEEIIYNSLSIKNMSNEIGVYYFSDIDQQYKIISSDYEALILSINNIINEKNEKNTFLSKVVDISSKIENLQKFSEWLNVDGISSLLGLDEKLSQMKTRYLKIESLIYNLPENNEIQQYSNVNDSLYTFLARLSTNKEKLNEKREKYRIELIGLEEKVGELNNYKTTLQEYALKVLSTSSDKTHCPVCSTHFNEYELLNLIDNISLEIENIDKIKILKQNIDNVNKQIADRDKDVSNVNLFIKIGKGLLPNFDYEVNTIRVIIHEIIKLSGVLKRLKLDIENLENLKKKFLLLGISESEYTRFINNYNERYVKDFGEISYDKIEKIKLYYTKKLINKDEDLKKFDKIIKKEEEAINEIKKKYSIDTAVNSEFQEYLLLKKNKLFDIKRQQEDIEKYIYLDNDEIDFLAKKMSHLSRIDKRLVEIISEKKKISLVVESLDKKLENDKKRDEAIDGSLEKLYFALELLKGLHSVSNRLENFFNKNTQSILDVFMNIHAPKEFDRLSFTDGKIMLKRIGSEEYDPINKISTGQKSALALSIFLTMNKNAQNAPKYILFDDPVSDIDDINILAFFDFLREIALSGERQIFFTTASSKIANLFKKKFDFLGEDFVYNYLER